MGSSPKQGPFWGPCYTGAVLHWGPKRGPNLENYLYVTKNTTNKVQLLRRRVSRHFVGVKLVSFGTQNPKPKTQNPKP